MDKVLDLLLKKHLALMQELNNLKVSIKKGIKPRSTLYRHYEEIKIAIATIEEIYADISALGDNHGQ